LPTAAGKTVAALSILLLVAGCGDDSTKTHCPEKNSDFFRESVTAYFQNHPPTAGAGDVQIVGVATYDEHTDWWLVPVNVGDQKLIALLSCDGHLELSGRPDK
jgi:hypothetical protein